MFMKTELQTLLSYSAQDRILFIETWLVMLGVDLALRMLPFRKVQNWVESPGLNRESLEKEQIEAVVCRASEFVDCAARHHLYSMTCLRRSLTLQWLLSRNGLETRLEFGVRRQEGKLQAHAWLEYQGQVIDERSLPDEQYTRLKSKGDVR